MDELAGYNVDQDFDKQIEEANEQNNLDKAKELKRQKNEFHQLLIEA